MLTLERVTKRFGGLTAVREVSLEVRAGDLLGIIGPNGAGKTTLFNVIAGYYRPDEGRVVFDGHDVTGRPAHAISRLGLTRTGSPATWRPKFSWTLRSSGPKKSPG